MCSTGSSCGQQGVIFNISYHRHQELLECHTFVTNHALFNASRSTLYISSSVEACPSLKVLLVLFHQLMFHNLLYYYLLLSLLPWQWFSFTFTLYHKIHELFYLWCQTNLKLQEDCAINAQAANHLKTAVIVTFLARSLALHQTAEPQEALWHFGGQCGARDCQNCKMCQMCQFD